MTKQTDVLALTGRILIAALFLCWPLVLFVVLIVPHRSPAA